MKAVPAIHMIYGVSILRVLQQRGWRSAADPREGCAVDLIHSVLAYDNLFVEPLRATDGTGRIKPTRLHDDSLIEAIQRIGR
jgi:hypothetical protein